jgi:hypothetical protein
MNPECLRLLAHAPTASTASAPITGISLVAVSFLLFVEHRIATWDELIALPILRDFSKPLLHLRSVGSIAAKNNPVPAAKRRARECRWSIR